MAIVGVKWSAWFMKKSGNILDEKVKKEFPVLIWKMSVSLRERFSNWFCSLTTHPNEDKIKWLTSFKWYSLAKSIFESLCIGENWVNENVCVRRNRTFQVSRGQTTYVSDHFIFCLFRKEKYETSAGFEHESSELKVIQLSIRSLPRLRPVLCIIPWSDNFWNWLDDKFA